MKLQNIEDEIVSPVHSTSSISDANRSDVDKSPSKCKKFPTSSSTNLDKVIEAVSKGILDESHDTSSEFDKNHVEMKPIKSPKVNGVQANLNETTKSPSVSPEKSSPQPKLKVSKKAKKEKEKKEKDKDKDKTKEKEKNKTKEKTKRKAKVKHVTESITTYSEAQEIKEEPSKIDETVVNTEHSIEQKVAENHVEIAKMDLSMETTNTSEVNSSKDVQPILAENSVNEVAANTTSTYLNGIIEEATTPPTKSTETESERKQNRKRRKEKHRNKHGLDSERSSSKEHKKKRKRKSHDHENPEPFPLADGVPKIKIKVIQELLMQMMQSHIVLTCKFFLFNCLVQSVTTTR